jgi:hypothetical protein
MCNAEGMRRWVCSSQYIFHFPALAKIIHKRCQNGSHQCLEDAAPLLVGRPIGLYRALVAEVQAAFADRDAGGRGAQTFDLRYVSVGLVLVPAEEVKMNGGNN